MLIDALWSGVLMGLALALGPMLVSHWKRNVPVDGSGWVGTWAASFYAGRALGLLSQHWLRILCKVRGGRPVLSVKSQRYVLSSLCLAALCALGLSSSFWSAVLARAALGACSALLAGVGDTVPLTSTTGMRAFALGLLAGSVSTAFLWQVGKQYETPALLPSVGAAAAMLLFGLWAVLKPSSFSTPGRAARPGGYRRISDAASDEDEAADDHDTRGGLLVSSSGPDALDSLESGGAAHDGLSAAVGSARGDSDTFVCPRPTPPATPEQVEQIMARLGDGDVPQRFLRGCNNDMVEAKRRWAITKHWRESYHVDDIMGEPQPYFDVIKQFYPHFIHGRTRNGDPIYIEQVGQINMEALKQHDVSVHVLMRHYVFNSEFMWQHVSPDPNARCVTLMDLRGLSMRDLAGEAIEFVRALTRICQEHYVERSSRIFVLNAPFWFAMPWKLVSPLLHPNTLRKVSIQSPGCFDALYADVPTLDGPGAGSRPRTNSEDVALRCAAEGGVIDRSTLPPIYGGTCPTPLGQSEDEVRLRALVAQLNENWRRRNGTTQDPAAAEVTSAAVPPPLPARTPSPPPASSADALSELCGARGRGRVVDVGGGGGGSASGPGLFARLVGALKPKPQARRAHMGRENTFRYDPEQKVWVMGEPDEASPARPPSLEDDMQERLIRAIQAAHGSIADAASVLSDKAASVASAAEEVVAEGAAPSDGVGRTFNDAVEATLPGGERLMVVYVLWRTVHMASLQVMPVFLLGDISSGGLGLGKGAVAVVLALASGTFLLFLMLADWLCADCDWTADTMRHPLGHAGGGSRAGQLLSSVRCLFKRSGAHRPRRGVVALAWSLRTAVMMQAPALLLLANIPAMQQQEWPLEIIWASLVGGVALILAALVASQVHRGVWLPSVQECRGAGRVPNIVLTLADAFGAILGPLLYATAVAPGAAGVLPALRPSTWLHLAALVGVVLCATSAVL